MFSGHGLGSVLQQIIRIYKVQNIKKWFTSMTWEFSYLLSFMEKEKLKYPNFYTPEGNICGLRSPRISHDELIKHWNVMLHVPINI